MDSNERQRRHATPIDGKFNSKVFAVALAIFLALTAVLTSDLLFTPTSAEAGPQPITQCSSESPYTPWANSTVGHNTRAVLSNRPAGSTNPTGPIEPLDFTDGFDIDLNEQFDIRIDGANAGDYLTRVSNAGDVNDDGIDDMIVGASLANNNGRFVSGSAYVVLGDDQRRNRVIDLARFGGLGFRIDGAGSWHQAGSSIAAAGDVNEDGLDDVLVMASGADYNGRPWSGSGYIVFGKKTTGTVDLAELEEEEGYRIDGIDADDHLSAGAGIGDVNDDGLDDVIVAASGANAIGRADSGEAYVVFGKESSPQPIDLAELGNGGYRIYGYYYDEIGASAVDAGDVNNDGLRDVIIGAPDAKNLFQGPTGAVFVVFSKSSTSPIDLSEIGTNGFRVEATEDDDQIGDAVSGAGDVNDDGYADLIVGQELAGDNERKSSGTTHVIFGKATSETVQVNDLGNQGFHIYGATYGDNSGTSVAGAGDMNKDRFADLIIGAPYVTVQTRGYAGAVYVVYGKASTSSVDLAELDGSGYGLVGAAKSKVGEAVSAAGDVTGNGRDDIMMGAPGRDSGAGSVYVVDGYCPGN